MRYLKSAGTLRRLRLKVPFNLGSRLKVSRWREFVPNTDDTHSLLETFKNHDIIETFVKLNGEELIQLRKKVTSDRGQRCVKMAIMLILAFRGV